MEIEMARATFRTDYSSVEESIVLYGSAYGFPGRDIVADGSQPA
jgi:hypothetical protein